MIEAKRADAITSFSNCSNGVKDQSSPENYSRVKDESFWMAAKSMFFLPCLEFGKRPVVAKFEGKEYSLLSSPDTAQLRQDISAASCFDPTASTPADWLDPTVLTPADWSDPTKSAPPIIYLYDLNASATPIYSGYPNASARVNALSSAFFRQTLGDSSIQEYRWKPQ